MRKRLIKKREKQPLYLFAGSDVGVRWLCLCSFTLIALTTTPAHAATTYESWIQQARQGMYAPALQGLQQYQREHSDDLRVQLDLIRVHYWAGNAAEVLKGYQNLTRTDAIPVDVLLFVARTYRVAQQPYEALRVSQAALALYPDDVEVIRNHALVLRAAGLHRQALAWQTQHAALFSPTEQRDRQAEYAAELTRLAPQPTRTLAERFLLADRAVQLQEELLTTSDLSRDASVFLQRVQGDRLIAVDVREDIVTHIDSSPARADQYPTYAHGALGGLQLRSRQPEHAMVSYQRALAQPGLDAKTRLDYQTGLAFALLEAGQEAQAVELVERMERDTPTSYRLLGNPEALPNPDHTDALILKNTLYVYTGLLQSARQNLAQASALAPSNVNLRIALADAQRLSSLPRQAERNLKIAETSSPRQEDLIISQAQTALELQEYRQAEELLNYAKNHYPTNTRVQELEKDWHTHRKNELLIRSGFESGKGADVSGQDGLTTEAQWYSVPFAYNWRATVLAGHLNTDDDLGHNVSWQGAGVQYRARDWSSQVVVNRQDWGQGAKMGASVEVDHDLNDYLRIGTTLDYRTLDIPNRALAQNITANRAQLRIRGQNGAEQWVEAAYTATKFSDHNVRHSFQILANQRLYTSPRFRVDGQMELWASANKAINALYFNPRREYMAVPTLRLEQLLYQRYEKRLSHALSAGAGVYHQQGYGRGGVAKAAYEINYQHDRDLEIGFSVQALSRPYDGKRERQTSGVLELKIKF